MRRSVITVTSIDKVLHTCLGDQNEMQPIMTPILFDVLLCPNRAFLDMGSFLNNDQFAVLHKILSVVGVFFFRSPCMNLVCHILQISFQFLFPIGQLFTMG